MGVIPGSRKSKSKAALKKPAKPIVAKRKNAKLEKPGPVKKRPYKKKDSQAANVRKSARLANKETKKTKTTKISKQKDPKQSKK